LVGTRSDARAGALHDAAVGDAGGAGSLAGAALEAEVEVGGDVRGRLDAAFLDGARKLDATSRRFRLHAEHEVSRAGLQAEAAVYAARQVFGAGAVLENVDVLARGHYMPPTKRPGLRMPFGSI
jgi:hypothetical protein